MTDENKRLDGPGREQSAGGESSGLPAEGDLDLGSGSDTLGGSGRRHWRESTISDPSLDKRGTVFFAALEMTRMPMILTDPNKPDNPIVFANRAFLDLTGYEADEILGRNCRFLQGVGTDREQVADMRRSIAARESISIEILNYRRDGSPFWNAVFVGPVYDQDGSLLYFFASQLDVTRRRNLEQVHRQAQKMEAIGQLTAGLAHDFNNLLQVVSGNIEMARGRLDDHNALVRNLDSAAAAAERGAKLTRQLLAFARKSRLDARPTDLTLLVQEFGDLFESTLGKEIELRTSLRHRLPAVLVDANHLEMALLNVLVNARDAMPKGGVVTIATDMRIIGAADGRGAATQLPPGTYVTLSVTDTGEGMEPQVLERATEPFFTTKPVGKGTGLGLAMVQGFAQQSRGRVEIESAPGDGTTIRMVFPEAADRAAVPQSTRPDASERLAMGNAERILIVEDSPDVLDLAQSLLADLGYVVLTARSAEEALPILEEALAGEGLQLVFTDLVMPGGMNGLKLAEEVRKRAPTLPILVTTGYNEELVIDGPLAQSMDVIGKPYRKPELADRIRAAIDRGDESRQRRTPTQFGNATE